MLVTNSLATIPEELENKCSVIERQIVSLMNTDPTSFSPPMMTAFA